MNFAGSYIILENIKPSDKKTHFGNRKPKCVFVFILS